MSARSGLEVGEKQWKTEMSVYLTKAFNWNLNQRYFKTTNPGIRPGFVVLGMN
jgi:hypothetical protein